MKISILITCYKHSKFIEEAINSAFNQTRRNFQLVIHDDFSPDNSREIITGKVHSAPSDIDISISISDKNVGFAESLNVSSKKCTGDFIIMGSGDDVYALNRVEQLAKAASNNLVYGVFSNAMLVDEHGKSLAKLFYKSDFIPMDSISQMIFYKGSYLGATCAYHKDVFLKFPPLLKDLIQEDNILPLRALYLGRCVYLKESLVNYRMHGGNLFGADKKKLSNQDIIRGALRTIPYRVTSNKQKILDLERAFSLNLVSVDQYQLLHNELLRQEFEAKFELSLINESRMIRFIKILREGMRRKFSMKFMLRVLVLHCFPIVYCLNFRRHSL